MAATGNVHRTLFRIYISEIVQMLPTLEFTDVSGLRAGGVWTGPNDENTNFEWRAEWLEDGNIDLVSWKTWTDGSQTRI